MEGQDQQNVRLSIGDRVQLHSLLRSPELNGVFGKIVKPQDLSTGRIEVEIENNGRAVAFLPRNLASAVRLGRLLRSAAPADSAVCKVFDRCLLLEALPV